MARGVSHRNVFDGIGATAETQRNCRMPHAQWCAGASLLQPVGRWRELCNHELYLLDEERCGLGDRPGSLSEDEVVTLL